MVNRIDILYKIKDTRAEAKKRAFESMGFKGKIKEVVIADSYLVDAGLNNDQIEKAANLLTNSFLEKNTINTLPVEKPFAWMIEIGLLPGVTDNVGATAKETIEDYFRLPFKNGENVYASHTYFLIGSLSEKDVLQIAENL